jgi:ribosome maturation protein SDO1
MASLDRAIIAHIKIDGKQFEIYVDPDAALAYRLGQKKDLNNVLAVEEIFSDAKSGERAKAADLQKAFNTQDVFAIAERILKEGKLALTTEQKRKMVEQKRKQIAQLIAREAIDPRTNAPHPLLRIEQAMEKVRLDIDPMQDAAVQVEKVLSALRYELPIVMQKKRIAVKVPAIYANRAYGLLKAHAMEREEWASDGSLMCIVTVPAGLVGEFLEKLNKATSGDNQTKML